MPPAKRRRTKEINCPQKREPHLAPQDTEPRLLQLPPELLEYVVVCLRLSADCQSAASQLRLVCRALRSAWDATQQHLTIRSWPSCMDVPARFSRLSAASVQLLRVKPRASGPRALLGALARCKRLRSLSVDCGTAAAAAAVVPAAGGSTSAGSSSGGVSSAAAAAAATAAEPFLRGLVGQLGRLHALTSLSITNCPAVRATLPASFSQLSALVELRLDGNELRVLPHWVCCLPRLQLLAAAANKLAALPEAVTKLSRLHTLDLHDNKLRSIPGALLAAMSATLTTLDVSTNRLKRLPDEIACMHVLRRLTADDNKLQQLPQLSRPLPSLASLQLSGNRALLAGPLTVSSGDAVSSVLCMLRGLTVLDLSGTRLTAVPPALGDVCSRMEELTLALNELTVVPECILKMKALRVLGIEYNNIEQLPDWLGQLSALQVLDVSGNRLQQLPPALFEPPPPPPPQQQQQQQQQETQQQGEVPAGEQQHHQALQHPRHRQQHAQHSRGPPGNRCTPAPAPRCLPPPPLRTLKAASNQLTSLPPSLSRVASTLIELDVSANCLTAVPRHLLALTRLESLDLGVNRLSHLPTGISHLRALRWLNVSDNQLAALPVGPMAAGMSHLSLLKVRGNERLWQGAAAALKRRLPALEVDVEVVDEEEELLMERRTRAAAAACGGLRR